MNPPPPLASSLRDLELGETDNGAGLSVAALFDQEVQSVVGDNTFMISQMGHRRDGQKRTTTDGYIEGSLSNLKCWNEQLLETNKTVQGMKHPTIQQIATERSL